MENSKENLKENVENQNKKSSGKALSDGAVALRNKLHVDSFDDLKGLFVVRGAGIAYRELKNITDRDGNINGSYSVVKITKPDCLVDVVFTGSEFLSELFIPFNGFYDFGFDIEKEKVSYSVPGSNGNYYKKDVETTKFRLVSFVEHKD
jgi:hypothetical protein